MQSKMGKIQDPVQAPTRSWLAMPVCAVLALSLPLLALVIAPSVNPTLSRQKLVIQLVKHALQGKRPIMTGRDV